MVIPTDSATPVQREKYAAYVAARTPRTAQPQGPARMLFARDLIGTSDEIAEQLYAHAGFREVTEVAFALPFTLRAPGLRADPHRHGPEARPRPRLAPGQLTVIGTITSRKAWFTGKLLTVIPLTRRRIGPTRR